MPFPNQNYHNHRQTQITLMETTFNDENCFNLSEEYKNVDVTISGCQSINNGISFISDNPEGNTVKISNSFFNFSQSNTEGAMLVFQGTILEIFNITVIFYQKDNFSHRLFLNALICLHLLPRQ